MYSILPVEERLYYEDMLSLMGSLSRLFSKNDSPYLDSRIVENLFCRAFKADNKSREDISVDAVLNKNGVGIKTFVGSPLQKIAEFNYDLTSYHNLSPIEKVKKIAALRNERIDFVKRTYGTENMIYHYIFRQKGKMKIIESEMSKINIERIRLTFNDRIDKTLKFTDGNEEYSFNISKSVLLKKFPINNSLSVIRVKIEDDPFDLLNTKLGKLVFRQTVYENPKIILPLYSTKNGIKIVPKKSGLNQWNAGGRKRDPNEVYIPIPAWIHKVFPGFFPRRDTQFDLNLPDKKILVSKVCQDNDKALMSEHNKDLGEWILRKVLLLEQNQLATFDMLQTVGVDSVIIEKLDTNKYSIDFAQLGSYDKFEKENRKKDSS